jgi:hypothetical protein
MTRCAVKLAALAAGIAAAAAAAAEPVKVRGAVRDAASGQALPCRISIQRDDGRWFLVRSASKDGAAIAYEKRRGERSVEVHTALSAHAFEADLEPGKYSITVERGKEYRTLVRELEVRGEPLDLELRLERWVEMAARGWFSGDTHVHRPLEELPVLVLAEDLNVALPLVHWVTTGFKAPWSPGQAAPAPEPIRVDATHAIYPLNTEYEIFQVGGKPHTLGAIFILNHRRPFDLGVPPLHPLAETARAQGALFELDKHNWPWSMALVPILKVDLFELANNHHWRAEFHYADFGEREAEYMRIERDARGFTERGWTDFGFQNYYALLNCGFRLRPTAGTASGVHPVALGFGRVYVQIEGEFSYEKWIRGLDQGRSFVTTGPMLLASLDGKPPGGVFEAPDPPGPRPLRLEVEIEALSERPLDRLELVLNGAASAIRDAEATRTATGAYAYRARRALEFTESAWIAARCFEKRPDGRERFAHSAPFHVEVPGRPLRPRRVEVEYLIRRVENEIARSEGVLPPEAIAEYRGALEAYRALLPGAR